MICNDVYPAVVQSRRTLLNDDDLIDAVRAGCGDDVADTLRDRLAAEEAPRNAIGALRDVLNTLRFAIMDAENAADDLQDVIEKSEST